MLVKIYSCVDEVIDYINEYLRFLGFYYFGDMGFVEYDKVFSYMMFGGVIVNDVIMYVG